MRVFLLLVAIVFVLFCLADCASERVEIGFEYISITKIDTVYRFGGSQLMITLQSKRGIEYVTYSSIENHYTLGANYILMAKK